jgi:phosphoadenylyl-sulfate reductase (thioredoxin)
MTDARCNPTEVSLALADQGAPAILAWASRQLGDRLTFATGFGAEGCVIIDLIARAKLRVDVFTLDTGVLFPETYALWRALEDRYGITIRAVKPAVDDLGAIDRLWETDPDRCCDLRKVKPLAAALAGFGGWITGIRRDQTPARAVAQPVEHDAKYGLLKVNPIVTWTHDDVWAHIYANDVPYNPLHDRGYPSIGCAPCTSLVQIGEDARAGRWRGSAKKECGIHVGDGESASGFRLPASGESAAVPAPRVARTGS